MSATSESSGSSSGAPGGKKYSMSGLFAAPKGVTAYNPTESFNLHVFWMVQSMSDAVELVEGLRGCGVATHRDTPCNPTYFFRISQIDTDLCPPPPQTVGEHPVIQGGLKKLAMGVPEPAVQADIAKRGVPVELLSADPKSLLPEELRQPRVFVECTEVYLDEQSFMEHVGSRDYMDAYGKVMAPKFQLVKPTTLSFGTPVRSIKEDILDVILKAEPTPIQAGGFLFKKPSAQPENANGVFFSLEVDNDDGVVGDQSAVVTEKLPRSFLDSLTYCVAFAHPIREKVTRLMAVTAAVPSVDTLKELATALTFARGEVHVVFDGSSSSSAAAALVSEARAAFNEAGLGALHINNSLFSGYALHSLASTVTAKELAP